MDSMIVKKNKLYQNMKQRVLVVLCDDSLAQGIPL